MQDQGVVLILHIASQSPGELAWASSQSFLDELVWEWGQTLAAPDAPQVILPGSQAWEILGGVLYPPHLSSPCPVHISKAPLGTPL